MVTSNPTVVTLLEEATTLFVVHKPLRKKLEQALALAREQERPIPMLLWCPSCNLKHIDEPNTCMNWTNPPHRSHMCQFCGCIWRPADVATTGVATIKTRGSADNYPREERSP